MKKVINKYILSFFIVLLILLTISLTGFFILKNYKQILNAFNIKIEENCQYENKKLICKFIDIKSKNLKANIKNLSLEIYLKKFFSGEKFLFLNVDNVNLQIISKESKKEKKRKIDINTIKKILRYSYFLLGRSEIRIKDFNLIVKNGKYFAIKGLSLENVKNQFYTLKPFKIIINDKGTEISNFYGELDPLTNSLNIYSLQFKGYNTEFVLTGSYRIDGYISISGHTFTTNYQLKNIKISELETFFDLNMTPTKRINYQIDYSLKTVDILDKNLKALNINGTLNGKYYKKAEGKLDLKIEKIKLNQNEGYNINFSSKYSVNINPFNFYSENNINVEKFENSYSSIKNISANFKAKKFGKLITEGNFDIDNIKGNFSFKEKENLYLETSNFRLSKPISWFKNLPKILNSLDSNLILKLSLDLQKKLVSSNLILNNVNLFGIPFANGIANISYNLDKLSGSYQLNLINNESLLNFSATTNNYQIDGDFEYKNINTSSLIFTKKQKMFSILTGTGKIFGDIKNPKIKTEGYTDYFFLDEIKIEDKVRYRLEYSNFVLNVKALTKNINSIVKIGLKPFFIDLNAKVKNLNGNTFYYYLLKLQPTLFKNLKPEKISGTARIVYYGGSYFVDLNIPNSDILVIPVENTFKSSMKGYISSLNNNLKISFYKNNFLYKNFHISKIEGKGNLLDKKFFLLLNAKDSKNLDSFDYNGFLNLDLKTKALKSSSKLSLKKDKYKLTAKTQINGKINQFTGNLDYKLFSNNEKVSSSKINIKFEENSNYHLNLSCKKIPFNFENKLISILEKVKYDIYISKNGNFDSYLYIDNLNINSSRINLLTSKGILVHVNKNSINVYKTSFSGVLDGNISKLIYIFDNNKLIVKSDGKINKQAISQIVQFFSIYGDVHYEFSFEGKISKFLEKTYLKLYSDNLKIKSGYVLGYVDIKHLLGIYKSKKLKVSLEGKNTFITYGNNIIKSNAEINIKPISIKASVLTSLFPIKYLNIFTGNINSNLYLEYGKSKIIRGNLNVSGQVNFSTQKIFKKGSNSSYNDNLKQIKLDIDISSYLPIYLYGNWGKAYAELKGKITGSAANPIFNGEINIIYGKITYLRNNYNIDFANIKVINNIPYVNARISTVVANTYIFVNITGATPNNLSFTFNSTPPKSKEEIMAILLLKNTPGALEAIPVFSAIGKLMLSIFPVNKFLPSSEENAGFLNTGFEITIAPRYSPTEGITASIYAKRNLTRRIFIAISRPISQTTQTTYIGWYEAGIKLTETISLIGRSYENNTNEINLIFSLPFDF